MASGRVNKVEIFCVPVFSALVMKAWRLPFSKRRINRDPWDDFGGSGGLDEHIRALRDRFGRILGGGRPSNGSNFGKLLGGGPSLRIMGLAGFVVLILWLLGGIYTIDEQERAVVLRLGNFESIATPGLNWNPLFIDRVYVENISRVRQHTHESEMLTRDVNIVRAPVTVQYNIKDIKDFVLNVEDPESSLQDVTESALRHVVGNSDMDGVLSTNRAEISLAVQARMQEFLDLYGTGLDVVRVNLLKGNPPDEVQEAFIDVVKAAEDRERSRNEAEAYANRIVPEARGRSERIKNEGRSYRASVIAEAEGAAQRFKALLTEYEKAPEVTRQRIYLEAIEEVLAENSKVIVDVQGSGNLFYLPLNELTRSSSVLPTDEDRQVGEDRLAELVRQSVQDYVAPRLRERASSNSRSGRR